MKPLNDNHNTAQVIHSKCVKLCHQFDFSQFIYAEFITTRKPDELLIVHGTSRQPNQKHHSQGMVRLNKVQTTCEMHFLNDLPNLFAGELKSALQNSDIDFSEYPWLPMPIKQKPQKTILLLEKAKRSQHNPINIHQAINALFVMKNHPPNKRLTHREQQCLQWASEGKTNEEISCIIGISKRTVIFHLKNAADKLNAVNRQHTVALAVSRGLVHPRQI